MTLQASSAGDGHLAGLAGALVDESLVGLLLLDSIGAVVETNQRGRDVLSAAGGLRVRRGRLCAHRPQDADSLDRLLDAALDRTPKPQAWPSTTVGGWPDQRPLTVYMRSLADRLRGCAGIAALVAVVDPWVRGPVNAIRVARSLGLTPAEGSVVAALAEGMTVCDIATARNRSVESVRRLVKQALAKTWCSRQADLVRLALSVSRLPVPQDEALD